MRQRLMAVAVLAGVLLAGSVSAQESPYLLPVTHTVTLTAIGVDADGFQSPLSAPPVWTVSDATKLTVVPSVDGLSAALDPKAAGTAVVTVTAGGLTKTFPVRVVGLPVALHIGVGEQVRKGGS